jgi:hypothetical protein
MHRVETAFRQARRFSFKHSVPAGKSWGVMHMALILSGHAKGVGRFIRATRLA